MTHSSVLLDTSFFIRFLNDEDPLFKNADNYFKYFIDNDILMKVSTISIAEYCVGGNIHELPLRNVQVLPFNLDHATQTGKFARIAFENKGKLKFRERNIIPNDTKLFAQAHIDQSIKCYLSSDSESKKVYGLINKEVGINFEFIDLNIPYNETFGVLDLN